MSTISLCLIAKDEEVALQRLLPQVRPFFDEIVVVDTGSTDRTVEVATEHGCVVGHFTWCDDFAKAREYSFSLATSTWVGWCDCDDSWFGLEKLRDLIAGIEANPAIDSLWLKYNYDFFAGGDGQPIAWIARHRRERFVKRGSRWRFVGRIHEHMTIDPPLPPMAESQEVGVNHHRDRSLDPQRNARNIRILMKALKDNPGDARTFYDLGSQFYHGMKPARAIVWYLKFLKAVGDQRKRPFESYQALHRVADCYRWSGRPDKAEEYDWQAFRLIPTWKDAPFGLAESAAQQGKWKETLMWTQDGFNDMREIPTDLLVLNDLDYSFHPRLSAHMAYANLGAVDEALKTVDEALAIIPVHEQMRNAKAGYEAFKKDEGLARASVDLAGNLNDDDKFRLYSGLPPMVRRRPLVRESLAAPVLLKNRGADVTIWCGPSVEEWGPRTPEERGIGGSETAVIEVAKRLGAMGVNVAVYNLCQEHEGKYGNVRYIDFQRYAMDAPTKLFVGWRNPTIFANPIQADKKWLWVHDCNWGPNPDLDAMTRNVDLFRPVSQWHANHLAWLYCHDDNPIIPTLKNRLLPTRNGIDLSRFSRSGEEPTRVAHLAVYGSSPDRGLTNLLAMWPYIKREVPEAELHVFYGWAVFDRQLGIYPAEQQAQMLAFKAQIENGMKLPGIVNHGRVTQSELAKWYMQAGLLLYPTAFLEVSHIGGMECMAAGTVIHSSQWGAIPETTAGAAALLRGMPQSEAYQTAYVRNTIAMMQRPELIEPLRQKGYERAAQLDWMGVAEDWLAHLNDSVKVYDVPQLTAGVEQWESTTTSPSSNGKDSVPSAASGSPKRKPASKKASIART